MNDKIPEDTGNKEWSEVYTITWKTLLQTFRREWGKPCSFLLQDLCPELVLDAMMHDKKAEKSGIGAVIVDEIGTFRFETLSREDFAARIAESFPNMI